MDYLNALRVLRNLRKAGVPLILGTNAYLLSPRVHTFNDNGWRIRLISKNLINYLNQIKLIIQEMNIGVDYLSSENYIEILQFDYKEREINISLIIEENSLVSS